VTVDRDVVSLGGGRTRNQTPSSSSETDALAGQQGSVDTNGGGLRCVALPCRRNDTRAQSVGTTQLKNGAVTKKKISKKTIVALKGRGSEGSPARRVPKARRATRAIPGRPIDA
jgi:hypothetical protein